MGGRATGLRKLFDERLPINRKERYYAGPPRAPASDLRKEPRPTGTGAW